VAPIVKSKSKLSLNLDLRWLVLALIIIIGGMLALWRPWQANNAGRSVSVSGQATIEAEPDEYVFSPSFELTGSDQNQLTAQISETVDEAVAALKALGVKDSDIKLSAYGGDDYYLYPTGTSGQYRVSANLSVSVDSLELAQQIQDYLATTKAAGQLTPIAQFSEAKRKELDGQAREQAIADARTKAEQSAVLLNAKLGKVLEVSEAGSWDFIPMPYAADGREAVTSDSAAAGLPVLPGTNDYTYSLNVKFSIR